ncbi:unnamed protein product [Candida verbasci]|uniref:Uncharacterized protein n=1 Tax=Candida verbasci TaxID=1227364 RepID=A0A9W4XA99_9ASCO|nr:unnamed protein product [Candida verbasci]
MNQLQDDPSFHPQSYLELQSSLIDNAIFKDNDATNSINLDNFKDFDNLLSSLENAIRSSTQFNQQFNMLAVPSVKILDILFTLASRNSSNLTVLSSNMATKLGIHQTEDQIKARNEDYDNNLMKSATNDRAYLLIKLYNDLIIEHQHLKLYENFVNFMNSFIIDQTVSSKTPMANQPTLSSAKIPKQDILEIIRPSPIKRRKTQNLKYQSNIQISDENGEEYTMISDPYEEKVVKSNLSMEEEVEKFQNTNKLYNPFIDKNNNVFNTSPKKQKGMLKCKIFDEPMLSTRLNPKGNDFHLWKLINWTFYCGGTKNNVYNSTYKSSHLIYQTQSKVINEMFRFLEFNFVVELSKLYNNSDPYHHIFNLSEKGKRLAITRIESSSSLLLSKLMKHLGIYKKNWYDRLIEYVFNGLTYKKVLFPQTCYDHEHHLLKKDENLKKEDRIMKHIYYNDNMSSMKLRFKIVNLVFYWSMVFDTTTKDGIINFNQEDYNYLSPKNLINELASKLMFIEYDYLVEFYLSMNLDSQVTQKYKTVFLTNLSIKLLKNITDSTEFNRSLYPRIDNPNETPADKWKLKNFNILISWLTNEDIISTIFEDETYKSFAHFDQVWNKFNLIFNWLLKTFSEEVVDLKEYVNLEELLTVAEQVDNSRKSINYTRGIY